MRISNIERNTAETKIKLTLNIDGSGNSNINTGVGFFDHMLTLFAKHSFSDLTLKAVGDLDVDSHHTVEDCGIVLGQALKEAIGDNQGNLKASFKISKIFPWFILGFLAMSIAFFDTRDATPNATIQISASSIRYSSYIASSSSTFL